MAYHLICLHKGSALDPLGTLSGPQTPRRILSTLTQNPGSALDKISSLV